ILRTALTRKPSTLIAIDRCIRLTEMTRLLSPLTASSTPLTPSSAPPRMQTLSPLLFELADRLFSKRGRVRTAYHDSSSNEPGLPASRPTFVVCATLTNRAPRFSLTGDLYISSLFEGPGEVSRFCSTRASCKPTQVSETFSCSELHRVLEHSTLATCR